MRALVAALLLGLAVGVAEARMARRRAADVEVAVIKPTPACASLSDADFQSAWQLLDEKCPKEAPYLCTTGSDCWKGMEALGYNCAKAAARAAATGTDVDAAAARIKELYRSNPTAMINWEKDERPGKPPVPVPSPFPSLPSPSPPNEGGLPLPVQNEAAGSKTDAAQSAAGTSGTKVIPPASTLPSTAASNAAQTTTTSAADSVAAQTKQEEAAAAKKKQEAEAAAKKKQEEAAAAKKKQEEAAAAAAAAAQQAGAQGAAAAAAKKRSPSPNPKLARSPSPTPKRPTIASSTPGTYTRAQVASHNTATNCWYIYNQRIYNVTPYLTTNRHPGGKAVIVRWCGKDATAAFNSAHGSGPAVAQQEAYAVGTLAA